MQQNERLKGESWEWFREALLGLAENTRKMYLAAFVDFLEWADTDTEALFEEHRKNFKAEDPRAVKRIPHLVLKYQHYLLDEGKSSVTAKNVEKAAKKFFKANELPFEISGAKVKVESEEIPNISKAQLRKVLDATGSYKLKAAIMLAKDSGLRIGDISHLNVGVFRPLLEDSKVKYFVFEWKQEKTKRMANPVIGPETTEALREWMRYRVEKLGISAEDEDPLFCAEMTRGPYTTKRGISKKGFVKGDWLTERALGTAFRQLVRKAGLRKTGVTIHSLRKYHKTNLEYGGCPTSWVNKMQGRKGVGTGGVYTKPNPQQLIDVYSRAYAALSVQEAVLTKEEMQNQIIETTLLAQGVVGEVLQAIMTEIRAARTISSKNAILKKFSEGQEWADADKMLKVIKRPLKSKDPLRGSVRPEIIYISKEDAEDYMKLGYVIEDTTSNGKLIMRKKP